MQTFSRKFLYKIDANSGIIIDVEYLGYEVSESDWILFTKVGILK
jgi:hypothetical protein